METIVLTDAKALNIYINPQRQNMLRILRLAGEPMTPSSWPTGWASRPRRRSTTSKS
jgi:hypothetical protein